MRANDRNEFVALVALEEVEILKRRISTAYAITGPQKADFSSRSDELGGLLEAKKSIQASMKNWPKELRLLKRRWHDDQHIVKDYVDVRVQRYARTRFTRCLDSERVLQLMDVCPNVVCTPRVTKYINPETKWGDSPRLYFGMGGGSQQLTKAFPMGAINMVFASEFLRRHLGLACCTVICGDVMTKTNPFSHADIDRIIRGERDMMQYLVDLFGFKDWNIMLMSELHAMDDGESIWRDNIFSLDPEKCRHPEYARSLRWWYRYIDDGIKASPYRRLGYDSRGHEDNWHFAMESAITHYTVGNGIHFGWYIPGPDIPNADTMERIIAKRGKPKVMDEQPFDEFYIWTHKLIQAAGGLAEPEFSEPDRITPIYSIADVRIPRTPHEIEYAPPYICYYPWRRLLMGDGPDQIRAKVAGENGEWLFPRRHPITKYWADLVALAEILGIECGCGNLVDRLCAFSARIHADGILRGLHKHAFPNLLS